MKKYIPGMMVLANQMETMRAAKVVKSAQHVQHSKHRTAPYFGEVKLGPQSGLRKLMRAAARNMLPEERVNIIATAMGFADWEPLRWMNASARIKAVGIV